MTISTKAPEIYKDLKWLYEVYLTSKHKYTTHWHYNKS